MRPMDGVGNRRCCAVYLPLVILLLLDIPIYCSQQPDKAHQRRQRQFISKKQTTESTIVLSAEELHHSTTPGDSSDQFPIDEDHGKDRSTTQSQSVERLERLLRSENAIDQVDEKKFPNNEFVAENVGAAAAAADTKLDYFKENGKQRWGKFFQQDPNAGTVAVFCSGIISVLILSGILVLLFYNKAMKYNEWGPSNGRRSRRRGTVRIFPKQSITI